MNTNNSQLNCNPSSLEMNNDKFEFLGTAVDNFLNRRERISIISKRPDR